MQVHNYFYSSSKQNKGYRDTFKTYLSQTYISYFGYSINSIRQVPFKGLEEGSYGV